MEHPLGIGAGQTERVLDYSTHSLYIRVLTESGLLGFFSFLSLVILTVLRSLRDNFRISTATPYAAIVTDSLAGVLFNIFFIDTLHWRHIWLLLALPGGGKAVENRADCHDQIIGGAQVHLRDLSWTVKLCHSVQVLVGKDLPS